MTRLLMRLMTEDSGQDMIEYALVATIVALSGVAVMRAMSTDIGKPFNAIGNALTNAVS